MTDLSEFKPQHPKGWEPSLQWDGNEGTITAVTTDEPDSGIWAELIADWGLNPDTTEVVDGSVQIRAWDTTRDGESVRLKYYRATIKRRTATSNKSDIDALCRLVEKRRPTKPSTQPAEPVAFLALLSDWQLGKGEGGGVELTVNRITTAIDTARLRFKALSKTYNFEAIYLIGLGDLVESCSGHYPMQTFQVELTDREQDKLARRLVLYAIDVFVGFGLPVVALGIPGNHGENRVNGKSFTDFLDNRDYSCFETVAEICAANPDRYGLVSFPFGSINNDDLTATLLLGGTPVSFAHGHQFRSGTNSQSKMEGWLKGQALGRTGVADAQILCAGHFHHFMMSESTGRTMLQVPAMDGGSKWYTSTSGANAPAGMVTLCVGNLWSRGWSELQIV